MYHKMSQMQAGEEGERERGGWSITTQRNTNAFLLRTFYFHVEDLSLTLQKLFKAEHYQRFSLLSESQNNFFIIFSQSIENNESFFLELVFQKIFRKQLTRRLTFL